MNDYDMNDIVLIKQEQEVVMIFLPHQVRYYSDLSEGEDRAKGPLHCPHHK